MAAVALGTTAVLPLAASLPRIYSSNARRHAQALMRTPRSTSPCRYGSQSLLEFTYIPFLFLFYTTEAWTDGWVLLQHTTLRASTQSQAPWYNSAKGILCQKRPLLQAPTSVHSRNCCTTNKYNPEQGQPKPQHRAPSCTLSCSTCTCCAYMHTSIILHVQMHRLHTRMLSCLDLAPAPAATEPAMVTSVAASKPLT